MIKQNQNEHIHIGVTDIERSPDDGQDELMLDAVLHLLVTQVRLRSPENTAEAEVDSVYDHNLPVCIDKLSISDGPPYLNC